MWVGDSLFSKPRWEPISLLSAISQRTSRVKLGTACMVSSTRNPLYLALEWATLDAISGGRTILGTGMGNPEEGVRREFAALGLDYKKRAAIFDEGLEAIRQLWTKGSVTLHGEHFTYDDVSFYSGTELGPLMPVQAPPPIWVVSNPRLKGDAPPEVMERRLRAACRRIVTWGDGWMTCCRAQHPEELVEQLALIRAHADEVGADFDRLVISYQVTMNIGESEDAARADFDSYISQYYPELSKAMDLSNWGPVGTPDQIAAWLAHVRRGRRGSLHLPVRRARPVRPGRALREGSAASVHTRASGVTRMPTDKLLEDAALVVDVCMSVEEDDVVTIICDDEHREQAEAVAAGLRRARRLAGRDEQRDAGAARPRRRALPDGAAAQPAPGDGGLGRGHHHHQPRVGQPLRARLGGQGDVRRQRQDLLGRGRHGHDLGSHRRGHPRRHAAGARRDGGARGQEARARDDGARHRLRGLDRGPRRRSRSRRSRSAAR